jgi:protein SCO1/2
MQAGDTAAGADDAAGRRPMRFVLPAVVLAVIIAGGVLLLAGGSSKQALPGNAGTAKNASFAGLTLSPPEPAPPLNTLRNYDGSSFNLDSDRGKAVFVTFLYAHCPDVCPLIAGQLHNTYAKMTPAMRTQVGIVVVSVDPHGDTSHAVAKFMHTHQLAGEGRYLIGSAGQLVPVWRAWNVGSEQDTSNPELVNHSALIYGISAQGRIYTVYSANFQPEQIIHDVPQLLAR